MARAYKRLGAAKPAAITETVLYTVPASTQTVLSQVLASNVGTSNATIDISIVAGGGVTAVEDTIVSSRTLVPDEIFQITGITLEATDVVKVESSDGEVVFHAYGEELT